MKSVKYVVIALSDEVYSSSVEDGSAAFMRSISSILTSISACEGNLGRSA